MEKLYHEGWTLCDPSHLPTEFFDTSLSSFAVSYTHLTLPTSDLVEISAVAVSLKKKKTEKLIFLTILLYINKHEENVYKRQLEDGIFFFFKQKTAYEISACLVGSEMCIRDRSKLST